MVERISFRSCSTKSLRWTEYQCVVTTVFAAGYLPPDTVTRNARL